ncbi:SUMO ligase siz1 [Agyrium rufum]|nr:SUMO ligase siz1 [Agyrium rufum]
MANIEPAEVRTLEAKIKHFTNERLRFVLKGVRAPTSGVKAFLQTRLIEALRASVSEGRIDRYSELKNLINNPEPNSPAHSRTPNGSSPMHRIPQVAPPTPKHSTYHPQFPDSRPGLIRPQFAESPFHRLLEPLCGVYECKALVREAARDVIEIPITATVHLAQRVEADTGLKVMVYCASEPINNYAKVDIAFPHQVELKVNGDEVRGNLRGLKNKPGTTRPADITKLLRFKPPGYSNTLSMTYAMTTKRFFVTVYLVSTCKPEDLVERLKGGKSISKDNVIREMVARADDSDIVATSSKMSLKCPLSTLRIATPCRSIHCVHNQCFDALSFLQLQEQAPTWTCPVCNKSFGFDALLIDQYVNDILQRTSRSVEQVTVEPDGRWSPVLPEENPAPRGSGRSGHRAASSGDEDDDEDVVEIADPPRFAPIKHESLLTPSSMTRTPPFQSREESTGVTASSGGSKRPISAVIDLTSDGEDEAPPRNYKRPTVPNGYSPTSFATPMNNGPSGGRDNLALQRNAPPSFTLPPLSSMGQNYNQRTYQY